MTKRFLITVAFGAAIVAAPAIAGEVNGSTTNHKEDYSRGFSFCKFSGLNDDPDSTNLANPPGRTQNFGQLVANFDASPQDFNPGIGCNPNLNPLPPELLNRP
jgi:hypothetical protein